MLHLNIDDDIHMLVDNISDVVDIDYPLCNIMDHLHIVVLMFLANKQSYNELYIVDIHQLNFIKLYRLMEIKTRTYDEHI